MITKSKHWDKTSDITRMFQDISNGFQVKMKADNAPAYGRVAIEAGLISLEIFVQDVNRIACASERIADALEAIAKTMPERV